MAERPVPAPKRRFDPGPPVAGLFFLAVAGVFLASGLSQEIIAGLRIVVPAVLLGLGGVMVIWIVSRSRRRR